MPYPAERQPTFQVHRHLAVLVNPNCFHHPSLSVNLLLSKYQPNVYELGLWVASQQAMARSTPSAVLVLAYYHFNFSFLTPPTLFIPTLLNT